MNAIKGIVRNGHIVLDKPADLPEGCRVLVEPIAEEETLESVEQRLVAVERELADVRARLHLLTLGEETPTGRSVRMLHEARLNQAALAVTAQEVFAALGISPQPVAAEAAQRQMRAEGVRPEDNAFSRGIRAMREE